MTTTIKTWLAAAFVAGAIARPAGAQPGADPDRDEPEIDIEVPVLMLDIAGGREEGDEEIDLANVVQSAAKGVTTVQEAPAIVTVLTGEDIYERGFSRIDDAFDTVPGWLRVDAIHGQFPFGIVRGTLQSMLYMNDGISLFSPLENTASVGRVMPLELVKRIEMVTGPGGVLWGANSYMGILNVITKDADDVDGVEADIRYGDGPGDRGVMRGYVMAGLPELFGRDDTSLLLHGSFDTYIGPRFEMPQHLFSTPTPQPNSQAVWGALTAADPPRSMFFQVNGKLSVGALDVSVRAPLFAERYTPLGFPGVVSVKDLPEDTWDLDGDGQLDCSYVDPGLDADRRNPDAYRGDDRCVDRGRLGRKNQYTWFDRFITASYRTRFADGRAGATVRAYGVQFHRAYDQLLVLAPTALLEGGLSFKWDGVSYRTGAIFDGDVELPANLRLLYGAEAFREWMPSTVTDSRQGPGGRASIVGPGDLSRIGQLPCPRQPDPENPGQTMFVPNCPLTFLFETDRTVLGAYFNPQWRPSQRFILDGGVRVQAAPDALSTRSYPAQFIFSGAAVVELAKDWHAKLNYTEGFRPPVFINTDSNGAAIQIQGRPDIDVENSQAIQGELNARLFRGKRSLREVNFRADYSYTRLHNLIQIAGGAYDNAADRGIHSVEFLGKVYLRGGHRVELAYTWLRVNSADRGRFRANPENWFNIGGVYNLIPDRLQATTTLRVYGAMEDFNRIIEYRQLDRDPAPGTLPDENSIVVQPYELVADRLPPGAELLAGLTWYDAFGVDRLRARAFAYNAFNTRHYYPDGFGDFGPRFEFFPNPRPDFRFVAGLNYTY